MKILEIYKDLLLEDFKSQRKKFIEQGFEPNIVDTYLKDFDEIRKSKFKEARDSELQGLNVPKGDARFNVDSYKTFRELEILVDYVTGQRRVGSANFEDIEVDGEPIFRNEEVEIYYADTPRACIQYKGNFPYSWCVARSDAGNMFYNYRLQQHEPAFYFVKLIKRTKKEFGFWNAIKDVFNGSFNDKYHFFVVQVTINNKYIVTSAQNDGDTEMEWDKILEFAPELTELKEVFQPKPLTKEEREKIEKYKNGLSDEEFAKLPYKEKEYYMAVYVQINRPITFEQFKILPEDLKNKYVGFGVGLSDEQFELIKDNKNLIKRYSEITKRKFDEFAKDFNDNITFTKSEQLFIQDKIKNLIIEKGDTLYIDDLNVLLPLSFKKEEYIDYYINLRGDKLDMLYELGFLTQYSKKDYEILNKIIDAKGVQLEIEEFKMYLGNEYILSTNEKDILIDKLIDIKSNSIDDFDFRFLLKNSSKKNEIINRYLNLKSYEIDDNHIIFLIILNAENKEEIIKKFLYKKNFILSSELYQIFKNYYSNPEEFENFNYKIINNNWDNLTKYDSDGESTLLKDIINDKNYKNVINYIFKNYKKINYNIFSHIFDIFFEDKSVNDDDYILVVIINYLNNIINDEDIKVINEDITNTILYNCNEIVDEKYKKIIDIVLRNDKFEIAYYHGFYNVMEYLDKNYEEEEKQNIINNLIEKDRLLINRDLFYLMFISSNESNKLKLVKKYKKTIWSQDVSLIIKWYKNTPNFEDKFVDLLTQMDDGKLNEQIIRINRLINII